MRTPICTSAGPITLESRLTLLLLLVRQVLVSHLLRHRRPRSCEHSLGVELTKVQRHSVLFRSCRCGIARERSESWNVSHAHLLPVRHHSVSRHSPVEGLMQLLLMRTHSIYSRPATLHARVTKLHQLLW